MPESYYYCTNCAPSCLSDTPNRCECPPPGAESATSASSNCGSATGRSVLLSSGQFNFNLPLLSIDSLGGIGWAFSLNYLSENTEGGLLGDGFNFPQNLRLELDAVDYVHLMTGENTEEIFVEDTINGQTVTYEPENNNNSRAHLIRTGYGTSSDELTLRASSGAVSKFYGFDSGIEEGRRGRLKSITDRYGSEQAYEYSDVDSPNEVYRLTKITDSYGRSVEYRYASITVGQETYYRLSEIEDFLERKLNFQYDTSARLVAVVTPSIQLASEGNTFPDGTAYVLEYDDGNDLIEKIYYPNQTAAYLSNRTVDVSAVYSNATARYEVDYDQDNRVTSEKVGDGTQAGGTYQYSYDDNPSRTNLIDATDLIEFECTVTDRNGNQRVYSFNGGDMAVRVEVKRNRSKINIPEIGTGMGQFESFITWTKYDDHNEPLVIVYPEGNSVEYEYDDGSVTGITDTYNRRVGLLAVETHKPGNSIGIASRSGSSGQTELTRRYFYDPIFNQRCAVIERRGNPIDGTTYFTPQNGGTTPTDDDRSRYATITYFDYQQNAKSTVQNDTELQALLFPEDDSSTAATNIGKLIDHVDNQLQATDGTGGIPDGFEMDLGDVNGDGTGSGDSSGLPDADHLGNVIKIKHPSVRLIGSDEITTQDRIELFTTNARGQTTTHTDPEGNVTVYVRYPENDPEGDGLYVASGKTAKQYGRVRAIHVDADPNDVLSLVGSDGDLTDFVVTDIEPRSSRSNTPGEYQNLVTHYQGNSSGAGGCAACAYDPLGNPLAETDARGFTTLYDRNELGEVYRTISPKPYEYQVETHYDANRNVIRVDTEDRVVSFESDDPASACYGQFTPSLSEGVAHVPTKAGAGGETRPGWFTNLWEFDLLDNVVEEDVDATGSTPDRLATSYEYDANENLVKLTKPEGNIVEYDYDERDLRIAERVGRDTAVSEDGAVTVTAYDANGNVIEVIGPAQRGASGNRRTVTIQDAFDSGSSLVHTGDFVLENTYDGFDRVTQTTDAAGNVVDMDGTLSEPCLDPDGRVIKTTAQGPIGGATPTDRNGTNNVDLSESIRRYDEAGRPYETQQQVFVANTSGGSYPLPSGRDIEHKGGGLASNSVANDHTTMATIYNTGGSNEDSYVLARTVYDRAGRVVESIADNTQVSSSEYDGASRRIEETDPLGNTVEYAYDPGGNVILAARTEKCTITQPTVSDETFRTALAYDCLGRLVLSASQGADGSLAPESLLRCGTEAVWPVETETLFTLSGYDSRKNQTLVIDPKGNSVLTVFDGASRPVQTIEHLRSGGWGKSPPTPGDTLLPFGGGSVATTVTYDGNGRVTRLTDDNNHSTDYAYDTLDRRTTMTFHDGSSRTWEYDEASAIVEYTDENGSECNFTVDPLGRRTVTAITLGVGVAGSSSGSRGTTDQAFEFDGLSRMTKAVDTTKDNGASAEDATVELYYDSLSRVIEESQTFDSNTRNVTHSKFESYPVTQFTFPNSRQLSNTYDALYRRTLVEETSGGADIASWQFFGPGRAAEVTLGNGLISTHMNNARTHSAVQSDVSLPGWGDDESDRLGCDGAGRAICKRFVAGGIDDTGGSPTYAYNDPTAVVGFTTRYDKASNKDFERQLHAESRSHLYSPLSFEDGQGGDSWGQNGSEAYSSGGHDSLDRLRQYQRGVLSDGTGGSNPRPPGGSVVTAISLPNTDESRTYDLDGLGNWRRTVYEPVGGSETTEVRHHNGLNQITRTDVGATQTDLTYDDNGNLTEDGDRKYEWDALNRLKRVWKTPSTPVLIGEYTYDALGRRIRKVISNGGLSGSVTNGTTDFIYNSNWQCVEERNSSNDPTKQYVWGIYIDELLQQKTDVSGTPADQYPLQDLLYRTMALTDDDGDIVEAYDYDAYGNTLIFTAAGTGDDWWADDATHDEPACGFLFTGRRFDPETELYSYRARYYNAGLGIFVSKDPIGFAAGDGNLYRYVGNRTTVRRDARGTFWRPDRPSWWRNGHINRPIVGGIGSGRVNILGHEDMNRRTSPFNTRPMTPMENLMATVQESWQEVRRDAPPANPVATGGSSPEDPCLTEPVGIRASILLGGVFPMRYSSSTVRSRIPLAPDNLYRIAGESLNLDRAVLQFGGKMFEVTGMPEDGYVGPSGAGPCVGVLVVPLDFLGDPTPPTPRRPVYSFHFSDGTPPCDPRAEFRRTIVRPKGPYVAIICGAHPQRLYAGDRRVGGMLQETHHGLRQHGFESLDVYIVNSSGVFLSGSGEIVVPEGELFSR